MSLSEEQRKALIKLYEYRENIEDILSNIDALLMVHFSDQYHIAYQHIIPQIKTALRNNTKWLSRGNYSLDHILSNIEDKLTDDNTKGVSKIV